MISIETKNSGTVSIPEGQLVNIPEGLFGFEDYTHYALVESEYPPFMWFQSTEEKSLAFLIIDPFLVCPDYEADIDDASLKKIGVETPEDIVVMAIVTIPEEGTPVTANLLGPLVINRKNNKCAQVILSDSRWTTKFKIGA